MKTFKHEVIASQGVVAANHPLASAAGVEILAMGGNAVDAAVGTLFTLTVVEPMMVGPLGAGFFVHRKPSGEIVTLDNYAVVPLAARPDMYDPVPNTFENETTDGANAVGHLSVSVPGALAGWCAMLEAHGTMPLAEVMEPAIRHATRGYPASEYLAQCIAESPDLGRFPDSAKVFHPNGVPATAGTMIKPDDLAATLRLIAEHGPDVLYDGPLGDAVVAEFAKADNWITKEDFAAYELHWRDPVVGSYRGADIASMPPVSSGGTHIIQILRLLSGFDVGAMGFGSVEAVHHFLEALKIAFADRREYLGDPAMQEVPVDWLTSAGYADERRSDISDHEAGQPSHGTVSASDGEGNCTTHLTVADKDGGIVATTQTIQSLFGAQLTVGDTGLLGNNCQLLMDPTPGRANSVAPGKRVLSSMSPTIISRDGQPWFALGTPGGNRIFAAVTQAIINVIDHGMTLQEAVEAPRVWTLGGEVRVEDSFPNLTELVAGLEALGHEVEVVPKVAGGMNGILFDDEGLIHGAACWRADGSPAGLSGGYARITGEALGF